MQINHAQIAKEFVHKVICANCVIHEGQCKLFYDKDLGGCYNKCWHYAKAVNAVKKTLDKYDK